MTNKNYYLFILFLIGSSCFSQSTDNGKPKDTTNFNRWSIELNVGQNKPLRPFATGYFSAKPNTYFYFNGIEHYDLGVRYMFSNIFGLKLDLGYDEIKNQNGSESLEFNTKQYRLGLQGVANLGRILKFEMFTHRIGLLAHGGIQISRLDPQKGINKDLSEDNGGIMLGITPQFKITNWLVLTGDFTALNNVRQHFNWDGTYSASDNNLTGVLYNTSLGLTCYLGDGNKKHADWYLPLPPTAKVDEELKKRIDTIETLMNDTDKDGIADYLDSENNTPAGVAVDSRGRFIDVNKNGVPDEMERSAKRIDQNFNNEVDHNDNNSSNYSLHFNALNSLVENKNINIYYDVNKDIPNSGSSNNVQQVFQYLKQNPKSKIKLIGYADLRGDESVNKDLSQRRAEKLKNFLAASGINENRIIIGAEGVDKTFASSTKTGLDLARRVSVEPIK